MMFPNLRKPSKTIVGGAIVIGVLSLASRFVGLLRDRIFAGTFGAGDTLDVYYAAFRIPDTVFALMVIGALSASFIPIFTKYYSGGKLDSLGAWKFTNRVLHLIAIGFAILAILGIIFADPLAGLIAPGFSEIKQASVASFMRVMFLAQFLLAISTVFGSVLQATKRFFLFSLAPVFYNFGIIFGAVVLVNKIGVIGLAWGVVIGAAFHLFVSAYGMKDLGYRYERPKTLWDKDTKEVVVMMLPRVLGLGIVQVQFIILSILASGLVAGSLSIFQLAFNLQFFPIGILGISFAISVFPVLSQQVNDGDMDGFVDSFSTTVRQILFFIIPATVIFLLLRAQIVRVVLGAGAFGWDETIMVADTLAFFSLSFFAQSINYVLIRGFFAFKDSLTPFIAGFVGAVFMIFASLLFTKDYGVIGLAMAFSSASLIQMALLWAMLRLRTNSLGESKILPGLFKMTIAGIGAALLIQFAKPLTITLLPLETFWGVLLQGLFAGSLGILAYLGIAFALKSEEFEMARSGFDRRILSHFRPAETPDETSSVQS